MVRRQTVRCNVLRLVYGRLTRCSSGVSFKFKKITRTSLSRQFTILALAKNRPCSFLASFEVCSTQFETLTDSE